MSFGPPRSSSAIADRRLALQNLITDGLRQTGEAVVRGNWETSGPIWIDQPGRVIFDDAVITPSIVYNPYDCVLGVTGSDVVLEGTLDLEERGYGRLLSNAVGITMLCTDLESFDFSQLHAVFSDTGVATDIATIYPYRTEIEAAYGDTLENLYNAGAGPSGPDCLFIALDAMDDFYASGALYGFKVGDCRWGEVGWFEHVRDTASKRSFGVRFGSKYGDGVSTGYAYGDLTHHCEDISVRRLSARGQYDWNTFECLGAGTRGVRISLVEQDGKSGTTMDFDKGSSRCRADRIVVTNGGKPTRYVGDSSIRFFGANIHGSGALQVTSDCSVGELIMRDCSSASTDPYEAGVGCQHAVNPRFGTVDVDNLNAGDYGFGALIDTNVDHVTIDRLRTRRVAGGLGSNANTPIGDVSVGEMDVEAKLAVAAMTVSGASGRVAIGGGRAKITSVLGGGVPQISLDAELARADIGPLDVYGGAGTTLTITCVAKASLADTDYCTVYDFNAAAKLYEFDTAGDGVTSGRVQVNVSTDTTAAQVAARLRTAILAAQPHLTVVDNANGTLTVTQTGGCVYATENVANAGFTITGAGATAPAGIGIYAACRTCLTGTTVRGQSKSAQANGAAAVLRCVGVDSATCTTPTPETANGGALQGSANSWQDS